MVTKENSGDGTGAASAGSAFKKGKQNGHCTICGHALLEIVFSRQCLVAHVCNNIHCCRDRSPQFYTKLPACKQTENKPHIAFTKPSYSSYLERKKHNYRLLRDHGVASTEAARMASNKQTRYYLQSNGYGYH